MLSRSSHTSLNAVGRMSVNKDATNWIDLSHMLSKLPHAADQSPLIRLTTSITMSPNCRPRNSTSGMMISSATLNVSYMTINEPTNIVPIITDIPSNTGIRTAPMRSAACVIAGPLVFHQLLSDVSAPETNSDILSIAGCTKSMIPSKASCI